MKNISIEMMSKEEITMLEKIYLKDMFENKHKIFVKTRACGLEFTSLKN